MYPFSENVSELSKFSDGKRKCCLHSFHYEISSLCIPFGIENCLHNIVLCNATVISLMKMFRTVFGQWVYLFYFSPTGAVSTCNGCDGAGDAMQRAKLKAMKIANILKSIFVLFNCKFTVWELMIYTKICVQFVAL